jgi:hypothetical protein
VLADRLAEHLLSNGDLPSSNGALRHHFSDLWFECVPQRSLSRWPVPDVW